MQSNPAKLRCWGFDRKERRAGSALEGRSKARLRSGAQLYRYPGSGTNWSWRTVSANAPIVFPDPGINLVMFDQAGMGISAALNYQIQSLDAGYNLLYTSHTYPLSVTNTGMVLDITKHAQ